MAIVCGDVNLDIFVQAQEPFNFGTDTHAHILKRGGGSASNVAWWLGRNGIETILLAKIGQDAFGDALRADLEQAGVKLPIAPSARYATGTSLILNDHHGERSMMTDRGANVDLSPEDIEQASDLFEGHELFHLSGYALLTDPPQQAALAAVEKALLYGLAISFDPCNHRLVRAFGSQRLLALMTQWQPAFVWPNLLEAEAMTGVKEPDTAAEVLLRHGAQRVIIKLGEEGAIFYSGNSRMVIPPEYQDKKTDTTGAGDAFCGTYLASYLNGYGPKDAGKSAAQVSSKIVGQYGARLAPDRFEMGVEQL